MGRVPGTEATTTSKCYVGAGVLPDLNSACGGAGRARLRRSRVAPSARPTAFGRCADCHGAGINGVAGGRDLLDAVGFAYENGNHCDVCHHVKDVDLTKPPGVPACSSSRGRARRSPACRTPSPCRCSSGRGPTCPMATCAELPAQVPRVGVLRRCHEQKQEALVPGTALDPVRWPDGLPTLSTYGEWAASAYQGTGATCQFCHMPPDDRGLATPSTRARPISRGSHPGSRGRRITCASTRSARRWAACRASYDGAVTLDLHAVPASGAHGDGQGEELRGGPRHPHG